MTDLVTSRFTLSSDAMDARVGDETVILHMGSGTYYGLNDVGARVWELMGQAQSGLTIAELCDVLEQEYDVPRDMLEKDIMQLMGDLLDNTIVVAQPA